MFRQSCSTIVIAILVATAACQARASIIGIPDAPGQTGTYTISNPLGPVSGEDSVYIVGRMTFQNAIDTSSAFDVVEVNAGGNSAAYQWGHTFSSDDFSYFFPTPIQNIDSAIGVGESYLAALKIDQMTGDYSFFVDPDFSMLESLNSSLFDRVGGPIGDISNVQFRGGNSSSNIVDFTGFAVYTGDDTPFAVQQVPEPASIVIWLILGVIGLGFAARRRWNRK